MNELNTPIRKSEPLRALSAATDEVKIAGGNTADVNVHVTNVDALAKESTALALLAALSGTLNVQEASAAKEATLQSLLAALTSTLTVSEPSAAKEATLQALLRATQNVGSSVWTDDSGAYYIQRQIVDDVTNNLTISYTDGNGNPATPGAGLKPATAGGGSLSQFSSDWVAIANTEGYSVGDTLTQLTVYDVSASPPTLVLTAWININSGQTLGGAPPANDIEPVSNTVTVSNRVDIQAQALPLPDNAAKERGGMLELASKSLVNIERMQSRYAFHTTQQIDESMPSATFIRKAGANAWDTWLIVRVAEVGSGTEIKYAGTRNNGASTTAAQAWSNRLFLTYGDITEA